MPCRDYDDRSNVEIYGKIVKLTRMLCDALKHMEQINTSFDALDKETQEWWKQHKAADKARKETRKRAEREQQRIRDAAEMELYKKLHVKWGGRV